MNKLSQAQQKLLKQMALIVFLAAAFALVLFRFPPDHTRFYPKCLLYATTGLQCPGCGGLRAAHHLLHGHWAVALHYNPLLICLIPVFLFIGACYVLGEWRGQPVPHPFRNRFWVWLLVGTILVFSVVRNFPA